MGISGLQPWTISWQGFERARNSQTRVIKSICGRFQRWEAEGMVQCCRFVDLLQNLWISLKLYCCFHPMPINAKIVDFSMHHGNLQVALVGFGPLQLLLWIIFILRHFLVCEKWSWCLCWPKTLHKRAVTNLLRKLARNIQKTNSSAGVQICWADLI